MKKFTAMLLGAVFMLAMSAFSMVGAATAGTVPGGWALPCTDTEAFVLVPGTNYYNNPTCGEDGGNYVSDEEAGIVDEAEGEDPVDGGDDVAEDDGNNGHGNDEDGDDESNPAS